ncbi:MAG: CapA family protein [bacterium]
MDEQPKKAHTLLYAFAAVALIVSVAAFYVSTIYGQGSTPVFAQGLPLLRAVLTPVVPQEASVVLTRQDKGANILFVGDMFFDRHIREVAGTMGGDYLFSCIDPLLQSADFVVGNLEGPITTNASVSLGSIVGSANNYRFTFSTSAAPLLLAHNIRAVSLGNNHIVNFGMDGLLQTHHYLDGAGVGYFGGVSGDEPVYHTEEGGSKFSFVGYNQFGGAPPAEVALTILRERAAGRMVIVFAHWGTEYSTTTAQTKPIATLFAEAGASVIIGSHPHVVGLHEYIGNTLVYYSLGNFIFDQYFSQAVMHGLAVLLHIAPDGSVTATEHATELERDGRTCPQVLI